MFKKMKKDEKIIHFCTTIVLVKNYQFLSEGLLFSFQVRYQSRKKLAEQRPRVRGQFVRQSVQHDHPERDAER